MMTLDVPTRRAFWMHLISHHPEEAEYLPLHDDFARWHNISPNYQLTLSIGPKTVAIFIRACSGRTASDVERMLFPHQNELAAQLGVTMYDKTKKDGFFIHRRAIDMINRGNWNRAADFLWYNSQLYERTLDDLFGKS